MFPDRGQILLQLHELDFTEGSPICGTEKDQHGALRTHDRLQSLRPAVLILRRNGWNGLAGVRACLDVLPIEGHCAKKQGRDRLCARLPWRGSELQRSDRSAGRLGETATPSWLRFWFSLPAWRLPWEHASGYKPPRTRRYLSEADTQRSILKWPEIRNIRFAGSNEDVTAY